MLLPLRGAILMPARCRFAYGTEATALRCAWRLLTLLAMPCCYAAAAAIDFLCYVTYIIRAAEDAILRAA